LADRHRKPDLHTITDLAAIEFLAGDILFPKRLDSVAQTSDEIEAASDLPKYITNYIGSKQKLIDWIWQNTPEDVKSVFDAFGGSNVVGFMYKRRGLKVLTNDVLNYSYHAARAIIENNSVKLSEEDIQKLSTPSSSGGDFIARNFKNTFFTGDVLTILDSLRANIDPFQGYKKDMALFALGKTCISGKGGFGHFSATTMHGNRRFTQKEFLELYVSNLQRISDLVFDNGQDNHAMNGEIREIAPKVKADLAYFDPPYATHFSTTNYETAYHFIEGLMTKWKGKQIKEDSKTKSYQVASETITKRTAQGFFEDYLMASKHFKYWILSYRDQAYPSERQIKTIIEHSGKDSRMKSRDHNYSISAEHSENSQAKEHIFICGPRGFLKAAKADTILPGEHADDSFERSRHLTIPCQAQLSSEAREGDPRFTFILTHAGTNANGDHFTPEELKAKFLSVVGKKIDLKHSQDITDIVGGVISAAYQEDNGGAVQCIGELYIQDNPHAQLAYKLLKTGIIQQVSMECDYAEGECSICHKHVKTRGDDCLHLKKYKGKEYEGQEVFEILHNITFTGLGLLDRAGADENARILSVAEKLTTEESDMSEMNDPAKSGNDTPPVQEPNPPDLAAKLNDQSLRLKDLESQADKKDERIKALEIELEKTTKELEKAQKLLENMQQEKQAALKRSQAEALLSQWEAMGRRFASPEERDKELSRLAGMSEEALKAIKDTVTSFETLKQDTSVKIPDGSPPAAEAGRKPELLTRRSNADNKPEPVDDGETTLTDQLKSGFLAAYQSRIGG